MRSKPGFTIVELLVVIAILSLLIALLLPALMKAREAAVQVRCLSNIRSCGQAMLAYASSNRNKIFLISSYESNPLPSRRVVWYDPLIYGGYFKPRQDHTKFVAAQPNGAVVDPVILGCPNYLTENGEAARYGIQYDAITIFPAVVNWPDVYYSGYYYANFYGLNLGRLKNSSRFLLLADSVTLQPLTLAPFTQSYLFFSSAKVNRSGVHLRHLKRANVCFADGHAESCTRRDLYEMSINEIAPAYRYWGTTIREAVDDQGRVINTVDGSLVP